MSRVLGGAGLAERRVMRFPVLPRPLMTRLWRVWWVGLVGRAGLLAARKTEFRRPALFLRLVLVGLER